MLRPIALTDGDEQDRERPEEGGLLQIGMGDLGEPGAGKENPGADRDQVEDADDVVGRRMIRSLLIPIVEPVELGGDHPRGQADHEEDEELGDVGMNPIEDVAERDLGDDEREDQSDDVRTEQRPAHEPAAAVPACCRGQGGRGQIQARDGLVLGALHGVYDRRSARSWPGQLQSGVEPVT